MGRVSTSGGGGLGQERRPWGLCDGGGCYDVIIGEIEVG
jgi:hypothetical protein